MAQNMDEKLGSFLQEVGQSTKDQQKRIQTIIETKTQECFANLSNEKKFVDCMQKVAKKTDKQYTRLEFKLKFWQVQTRDCFHNNPNGLDKCQSESRKLIDKIFNDFNI